MAKGIRVNQLAKELNVESKAILGKLRDEGLAEKAPNHMSVLPLGLAESVREWFAMGSGGGTAVETAAPPEVATKPKTARKVVRKKSDVDIIEPPAAEEEVAPAIEKEVVNPPVNIEPTPPVVEAKAPDVKPAAFIEPAPETVILVPEVAARRSSSQSSSRRKRPRRCRFSPRRLRRFHRLRAVRALRWARCSPASIVPRPGRRSHWPIGPACRSVRWSGKSSRRPPS